MLIEKMFYDITWKNCIREWCRAAILVVSGRCADYGRKLCEASKGRLL